MDTSDTVRPGWRPGEQLEQLEQAMCHNAAAGDPVKRDGPFDLADMEAWGKERTVRAAVLRHLLITDEWPADAKGVRLRGVRISGLLDLEAATLRCPLFLESCYLDASEPACLDYATASRVTLTGCRLAGLTAEMLTATDLTLSRSTLTGPLGLAGTILAGSLICSGAQLTGRNKDGDALSARGIKVGGDAYLDQGFTADGTVVLNLACIAGILGCQGAQLTGREEKGYALFAFEIKVGGHVALNEGFIAVGTVNLGGADITGMLSCDGAQLTGRDEKGDALSAFGIKVSGDLFLGGGCIVAGAIELGNAEIMGTLVCGSGQLTGRNEKGDALSAGGIKVGGDVFLSNEFTAAGAVKLAEADIIGSLGCIGAQLTHSNENGEALSAAGIKVGGDVDLDERFTAVGAIELGRADITGTIRCSAQLTGSNKNGDALSARRIKVGGDVYLHLSFTVGGISLVSARLSGLLSLMPTRLAGDQEKEADQKKEVFLDASRAQITGALRWLPTKKVQGKVNLQGAAVGELIDNWTSARAAEKAYWPSAGQLNLDGFTYASLGGYERTSVGHRLTWIRAQYQRSATGWEGFATQPYEQLTAVYRHTGQDAQARKVAIARRADLRKYGNLNAYRWAGNWLLDKTIKYGYQAWRAAVGLVIIFAAFLVMSVFAQHHHVVVPVGNLVGVHPVPVATRCTSSYPCFYPAGYAIDVVIPIINVHEADHWVLDGHPPGGWVWVASSWVATGLGWALVTLLVAGYTGLVRRQ